MINNYLTCFPPPGNRPLSNTEMVEIIDRAKPHEWHTKMLETNVDPCAMSITQLEECFMRLETAEKISKCEATSIANQQPKSSTQSSTKDKHATNDVTTKTTTKKKYCVVCDMKNHNTIDCGWVKQAKKIKDSKNFNLGSANNKKRFITHQEAYEIWEELNNKATKKKKLHCYSSSNEE